MSSNAEIVDIEYPEGICSPIFVVEKCFGFEYSVWFLLLQDNAILLFLPLESYAESSGTDTEFQRL